MEKQLIDKQKIIDQMEQRMNTLKQYLDRDYGANTTGYYEAYREVKYWKECIERGVFDEDDIDVTT